MRHLLNWVLRGIQITLTYFISCVIIGTICGAIFWTFAALGLIRIKGYWKTWRAIYQGKHVIISNHPSMRDPFLLMLMWYPWCLIMPHSFFVWNLPGKNYFTDFMLRYFGNRNWKEFPEWIYPLIHCIPVARDGSNGKQVITKTKAKLRSKQTVVIFGEMGRTSSPSRDEGAPEVKFVYSEDKTRKIRTIESALIKAITGVGATCSTVWIDMPLDPGFGLGAWLSERHRVTITFSDSYTPDGSMRAKLLNADVESRILAT